jgi:hypothetical protein
MKCKARGLIVLPCLLVSLTLGCSKVAAQENVIARFTPLQAGESFEYSLAKKQLTVLRKGLTSSFESIYTHEKVHAVQKLGSNLLFSIDPGGIYRGYNVFLIVGTEGEIRNIGEEDDVELFNDYVLFLRFEGLDAPDYPVIEVYSIKDNKVLYTVSLTKYAQDCLWKEWRQQITVQIFNEAKINYARIAFLAEELSAMDVYLDISTKKIKAICNWK